MAISGSDEPVRVNMETVPVGLLFPFLKSIPAKPTWIVSINAVEAGGSRSGLFPSPPPPSPRATAARGAAGAALRTCRELAALTQPRSGCPPPPGLSFLVSSSGSLRVLPLAPSSSLYPWPGGSSPVCPGLLGSPAEALTHLGSSLGLISV